MKLEIQSYLIFLKQGKELTFESIIEIIKLKIDNHV